MAALCQQAMTVCLNNNGRRKRVERGSSAVECRTRNLVSPGSNPFTTVSKIGHFRSRH